jgi:hypothetical protein
LDWEYLYSLNGQRGSGINAHEDLDAQSCEAAEEVNAHLEQPEPERETSSVLEQIEAEVSESADRDEEEADES